MAGAAVAGQAPGAWADGGQTSKNETLLVTWYGLWGQRFDWAPFDAILADDFTFTSPLDDHISKARFKTRCWETNNPLTKGFDLQLMMSKGDEVFVQYLGHTAGGKTFPNVEVHRVRDGRIVSTRCYFGADMSFPAAVDSKQS